MTLSLLFSSKTVTPDFSAAEPPAKTTQPRAAPSSRMRGGPENHRFVKNPLFAVLSCGRFSAVMTSLPFRVLLWRSDANNSADCAPVSVCSVCPRWWPYRASCRQPQHSSTASRTACVEACGRTRVCGRTAPASAKVTVWTAVHARWCCIALHSVCTVCCSWVLDWQRSNRVKRDRYKRLIRLPIGFCHSSLPRTPRAMHCCWQHCDRVVWVCSMYVLCASCVLCVQWQSNSGCTGLLLAAAFALYREGRCAAPACSATALAGPLVQLAVRTSICRKKLFTLVWVFNAK